MDHRNGQKWAEMDINGQKGAEMDKKTDKITQPTTRRVLEYSALGTRASTFNTRTRLILDFLLLGASLVSKCFKIILASPSGSTRRFSCMKEAYMNFHEGSNLQQSWMAFNCSTKAP